MAKKAVKRGKTSTPRAKKAPAGKKKAGGKKAASRKSVSGTPRRAAE